MELNLIQKKNIKLKEDLERFAPLRERGYESLSHFGCIECGEGVSPATVRFFDYNVENVICYKCQDNNK